MPKPEEPESYEEQLAAIHERLDLAEHEIVRVRMGFETLLVLARNMTELFPVLAEAIRDIAAGLELDLDEDGEGEPEECEEVIRLGGVEMTIGPDGEIAIEKAPRSGSGGSGL